MSSLVIEDYTVSGGIESIVDILNSVDRGTEKYIMETLEIEDLDLVEEIKKRMFVFEDILILSIIAQFKDFFVRLTIINLLLH